MTATAQPCCLLPVLRGAQYRAVQSCAELYTGLSPLIRSYSETLRHAGAESAAGAEGEIRDNKTAVRKYRV